MCTECAALAVCAWDHALLTFLYPGLIVAHLVSFTGRGKLVSSVVCGKLSWPTVKGQTGTSYMGFPIKTKQHNKLFTHSEKKTHPKWCGSISGDPAMGGLSFRFGRTIPGPV